MNAAGYGQALDRVWVAGFGAAAATVVATSEVGINLWFASGWLGALVAFVYVLASAAVVIDPDDVSLHRAATLTAVLFWGGRAVAFVALAADGRPSLWGAVAERLAIAVAVLSLHLMGIRRIAQTVELRRRGLLHPRARRG